MAVFYTMLRPEFLASLQREGESPPISPDAFSNWASQSDASQHDEVAAEATRVLLTVAVPRLARSLDRQYVEDAFDMDEALAPWRAPGF